jgi:geranylgeranyl reductase family protein
VEIYHFPRHVSVLIIGTMEKILVIGAGPAGSACAWKLSRAGIHCVLADMSAFPRPKICGGIVSKRAVNLLVSSGMVSEMEMEDLFTGTHTAMTISSDFSSLRTYRDGFPPIHRVNRTRFDAFLRRRALEEGAVPLKDRFVDAPDGKAVFHSGEKLGFERMVGADGASSRVRKLIYGGKNTRRSPALSTVVPLSEIALQPYRESGLHIFFFKGFCGYGWLFPGREDVTVGVGSFGKDGARLRDLMGKLLIHTGLGTSHPVRGAVLPAGGQPVIPGTGRILLTGDAAGLCDKVSGEGISHAIESGFAAADAIIKGLETWHEGSKCVELVLQSGKYRKLLYNRPFRPLAIRALKRSDRWYRKYWSIVSGDRDYSCLLKL